MSKKLFAACLVIAAFAVVPSFASANPILTEPTGTALGAGATITATNVGETTLVTSTGTLSCSKDDLHGTLVSNATAAGVKGEITAAKFGGTGPLQSGAEANECTGSNFFTPNTTITPNQSLPWCLEAAAAADTFSVKGGKCGAATAISFKLDVTGVGTCEYTRAVTSPITGTLVTDGGGANENTAAIANTAFGLVSGPGLCPGEGKLNMRFSLETTTGAQIFISS